MMRNTTILQKVLAGALSLALAGGLTACGSSSTADTNTSSDSSAVTVIPVGVCSTAKPDAYIDDDGNLTGFDVETLRAIDELLPQYEFDLQTMEFSEILNSLSTGKISMGSQEFEWNKEREENYLFGTVPLVSYKTYIVTLNDSQYDHVTGFADLAGKTTQVSTGGSTEAQVNSWNEAYPDAQIETVVAGTSMEDWVNNLNNGVVDFLIFTEASFKYFSENYDTSNWVLHTDAEVYDSNSYILFGKTQTELQEAVDGALQELTDNGTLSELSVKFYGKDYTVKAADSETTSEAEAASSSSSSTDK